MSRTYRYDRKTHTAAGSRDTIRHGQYKSYGCRHHGDCDYCANGRTHSTRRRTPITE